MRQSFGLLAALVVGTFVPPAVADPVPANNSFEKPDLGTGVFSYQYNVTIAQQGGAGWNFVGTSGIAANNSAFNVSNAPDGHQAGFLQQNGTFSQTVSGFAADTYTLSFFAEGRPGAPYGQQAIGVRLDGMPLSFGGELTVAPPRGSTFVRYTTDVFAASAGSHTLTFSGLNGIGDNTAFVDLVTFAVSPTPPPPPARPRLFNGSFESPGLGTGVFSYQYNVSIAQQGGAGWTFNGSSGIAAVGSAFDVSNTPDGTQAGFLQGLGNFNQTVTDFDEGNYTLSFFAEGRPGAPYGQQSVRVTLDGVPLGFGDSTTLAPPRGTTFVLYTSDLFHVSAGAHVLAFLGLNGSGDNTAFIDAVRIAPIPEPSTLTLLALGSLGLLGYGGRRRAT
jgi:hypothetical protein